MSRKKFKKYCENVFNYIEQELMISDVRDRLDFKDVLFFFKRNYDVQSAAIEIREILSV